MSHVGRRHRDLRTSLEQCRDFTFKAADPSSTPIIQKNLNPNILCSH